MKLLFAVFLLFALSHARITVSLDKVYIDSQTVQSELNKTGTSIASGFMSKSSDPMQVTLMNLRNYFYFGNIYIGSKNLTMKVLFDTGSNDLWLSTPSCAACSGTTKFDCRTSTTCKQTSDPKSLAYGLGQVSGVMGSDMVGLTPTYKVEAPILLVTSGSQLNNYYLVDGFLGLGSKNDAKDYIDLAYDAGQIDAKIFSIHLDYNKDNSKQTMTNTSFMTIGYVPEDKINNLGWVKVTVGDRWATDILGVRIGDTTLSNFEQTGTVLFDTGCSLMYMTSGILNAFVAQMNKFEHRTISNFINTVSIWPCEDDDLSKYPNISLSVAGLRIEITPKSYFDLLSTSTYNGRKYCQQMIQPSTFGMSILGDAFLKDNFIAYSKLNQTIGVDLSAGHQVLPNPNPPLYVFLIQVALMLIIAAVLFMQQKKKTLAKPALADTDTLVSNPVSNNVVY